MLRISFRLKIIISLTVICMVTTYLSFQILYMSLAETIYNNCLENNKTTLSYFRDRCFYAHDSQNGMVIYSLLDSLKQNHNVINTALLNKDGKITYSSNIKELTPDSSLNMNLFEWTESMAIDDRFQNPQRVMMRINNSGNCYSCHDQSEKILGYLVVDFSMHELNDNLAIAENIGQLFTFIFLIIILLSMFLLHYRIVRRSLRKFKNSISQIEKGNMDIRVHIPSSDELGILANSFNRMLDQVQKMQYKIAEYHHRELMDAQKLATVGEMAAAVAHEIKNPLTGISNAMEIIVEDMNDMGKKPILKELHRQVQRVNNTINSLLNYSKSDDLQYENADMNQLIRSAVYFHENQINSKKVKLQLMLANNIPEFKFDPKQMETVIINIIQNALQEIRDEGVIKIKTEYDANHKTFILNVHDSGNGIPIENMDKIFKPFFTTRNTGTGLGLAISRDVIHRHGGTILIDSKMNEGTSVIIKIPTDATN